MSSLPVGILLAAGNSRRFGSNKLLYPVIENTPMILVCAARLVDVLPDSIVVINQALSSVSKQLEQMGLRVVINDLAEHGMGSSLACGIRASDNIFNTDNVNINGWLIMLADMPYIETTTIQKLVDNLEAGSSIVAPVIDKKRGHPVGFSQHYKNELLALNQDIGAREVLKKYQGDIDLVEVNDEGILLDIDQLKDIL